jgi:hypothetical protein
MMNFTFTITEPENGVFPYLELQYVVGVIDVTRCMLLYVEQCIPERRLYKSSRNAVLEL